MAKKEAPINVDWSTVDWQPLTAPDSESTLPYATHEGVLRVGDFDLKCFQLSNGQRVFDLNDVERLFGGPFVERPEPGGKS